MHIRTQNNPYMKPLPTCSDFTLLSSFCAVCIFLALQILKTSVGYFHFDLQNADIYSWCRLTPKWSRGIDKYHYEQWRNDVVLILGCSVPWTLFVLVNTCVARDWSRSSFHPQATAERAHRAPRSPWFLSRSALLVRLLSGPVDGTSSRQHLGCWEARCSQETLWGCTHVRQPHWRRSVWELTCDSHAPVVFALLYGFHDLVGTAHKAFSTPLGTHAITRKHSVQQAPKQVRFTEEHLSAQDTPTWCIQQMLSKAKLCGERNLITSSIHYFVADLELIRLWEGKWMQ